MARGALSGSPPRRWGSAEPRASPRATGLDVGRAVTSGGSGACQTELPSVSEGQVVALLSVEVRWRFPEEGATVDEPPLEAAVVATAVGESVLVTPLVSAGVVAVPLSSEADTSKGVAALLSLESCAAFDGPPLEAAADATAADEGLSVTPLVSARVGTVPGL